MSERLAVLRDFAQRGDAWKSRHQEVMRNYETADALAEQVAFAVFLYERFSQLSQSAPQRHVSLSDAEQLCNLYTQWYEWVGEVLARVEEFRLAEFPVAGVGKLRAVHCEVGATLSEIETLRTVIGDFRRGDSVPFEQLRHKSEN